MKEGPFVHKQIKEKILHKIQPQITFSV